MDFISNILKLFRQDRSNPGLNNERIKKSEVPENKSLEFVTHVDTIEKEFKFLTSEFGFIQTENLFVSREFVTKYLKDPLQVEIIFELGSLPFICIRNKKLPYDESKQLDNRITVEDIDDSLLTIEYSRNKRRGPKQERFMDEWLKTDNIDLTELTKDYQLFGHKEQIEYIQKSASAIRQYLETTIKH